ncbi:lactonase family protein [Chitinophaga lutea]
MQFRTILILAVLLATGLTTYAQRTVVFAGSYNWDRNTEGIYIFQLDTIRGKLQKIRGVKDVRNPSYLTLSPNGRFLYACTDSKTPGAGSVSAFVVILEDLTLRFLNSQPSGGENPAYVSVHGSGKWLASANYTGGSMSVFPVKADGSIGPAVHNIFYTDSSVNKQRQERSHAHSAVFDPAGGYLFLQDLGADKIRTYRFNAKQGRPLLEAIPPFAKVFPGGGPRHLTFHPDGRTAYCIEEMGGALSVYRFANGRLDSIQRIFTHSAELTGGFESSDVHVSPDGRFLYATNRGKENNIAIFTIARNGRLTHIGYQPTGGEHPRTFALSPDGRFVVVANVLTHSLTVFRRDGWTGLLEQTDEVKDLPNVSTVQVYRYK